MTKTLTLKLGQYKDAAAYLKAIKKTRQVSSWAESLITQVPVGKKRTVEVALLTFFDLGVTGYPTTQQIKDAAAAKGYGVPDVEIALALALKEQEIGDWWITLHDPIKDSGGGPSVLSAYRRDEGRWVDAYWVDPGNDWSVEGAFAFVVPASTSSSEPKDSASETLPLVLPDELVVNGVTYRRV